jgi:hypothetical protein
LAQESCFLELRAQRSPSLVFGTQSVWHDPSVQNTKKLSTALVPSQRH